MSWVTVVLSVFGVIVFAVVLLLGVVLALVGLPGTVVILADAVVYSAVTGWRIPIWMLLVLAAITAMAELGDNVLTAMGVRKYGGSTAGMIWAVIGGLGGAAVGGAAIGAVVPLVGSLIGSIIGGLAGGFCAAYWYEKSRGRDSDEAREAGKGALVGRIAAAMLRSVLAAVMIIIILIYAF